MPTNKPEVVLPEAPPIPAHLFDKDQSIVWAAAWETLRKHMLSAARQQHGQEVGEVESIGRAFLSVLGDPGIAWRNTGAHEFIERVSQETARQKSAAPQQPAEAVLELMRYFCEELHGAEWEKLLASRNLFPATKPEMSERERRMWEADSQPYIY